MVEKIIFKITFNNNFAESSSQLYEKASLEKNISKIIGYRTSVLVFAMKLLLQQETKQMYRKRTATSANFRFFRNVCFKIGTFF